MKVGYYDDHAPAGDSGVGYAYKNKAEWSFESVLKAVTDTNFTFSHTHPNDERKKIYTARVGEEYVVPFTLNGVTATFTEHRGHREVEIALDDNQRAAIQRQFDELPNYKKYPADVAETWAAGLGKREGWAKS